MLLEQSQIDELIVLTKEAGKQAKKYYNASDIKIEYKTDKSPVTIADQHLSDLISTGLQKIAPHIPIISEEADIDYNLDILRKYRAYWLVDPIDGTKSFIRKKGDFTVNISLIVDEMPVFGIIYQPLKDVLYYTGFDNRSYKEYKGVTSVIQVNKDIGNKKGINIVVSTRSLGEEIQNFIASLNIISSDQATSSFKFCLVAEGKYDLYANFSRINSWDIAAGHAILLGAGGMVYDKQGKPLRYLNNSLKSPHFIAFNLHIGEDYIREKLAALS